MSLEAFDDWSWGDAPAPGEVTNEGFIGQGLDALTRNFKDLAIAKAYWEGDAFQDPRTTMYGGGYEQAQMLGAVERPQNVAAGQGVAPGLFDNPDMKTAALIGGVIILFALVK